MKAETGIAARSPVVPGMFGKSLSMLLALYPLALGLVPAHAAERNANFNVEQHMVESARYYHQMEADAATARTRLQTLLAESKNQEILTQARFLLGKILDEAGSTDSALQAYKLALGGKGLLGAEKFWLYRRMMSLSPVSIEPMVLDAGAKSGPTRIFPGKAGGHTVYTLEFRGPPDGQWERPKELAFQDAEGDYRALGFQLPSHEEVLDATPDQCLSLHQDADRVSLRSLKGGIASGVPALGRIDDGKIVTGAPGEFVLMGAGRLRHFRQDKLVWEATLEEEGCAWTPLTGLPYQGVLLCSENRLFRIDLRKKILRAVPGMAEKPLQVSSAGEFLALKYLDRFEIRKGHYFETVKWGAPSQLQEKLILGKGQAFLVHPKGLVKSFHMETGHLEWQKDMLANQLVAYDHEIFATTFAQTCVSLDPSGKVLWTYEYGWNREPTLLPNETWLVLHYGDGKRVKLNRELLRVTGNSDAFKFMDYQARETEKDWKGALASASRILALEPGNGLAWKYRGAALKNLGSPRPEQLQCLVQASRSLETQSWSNGPALKNLAVGMAANWAWKRQYGPKFYPTLVPHKDLSFYLENDNQTLVLLNHETGALANSFHFSEELDLKVNLWKNDTICVSSPSRIYLISPDLHPGSLGQFPLKNPVCQAQAVQGGLVYSDWYGNLNLVGLPDRTLRWERRLGQSGLLVGKAKQGESLDVIDLEGNYFAVQASSGDVLWSLRLPPGTITESFSTKDQIFAGYNQGMLICIDRAKRKVTWMREFGEQIFSLSGNRENTLVLTTASKKLICVQASTGAVQSQVRIQSYLFNRPTVTDQGYWLGTTEPALEKRGFNHELLLKYRLPDLPGSPVLFGNSVFIGTLDNFIFSFPS